MRPDQNKDHQSKDEVLPMPLFCSGDVCFYIYKDKAKMWKDWVYPSEKRTKGDQDVRQQNHNAKRT